MESMMVRGTLSRPIVGAVQASFAADHVEWSCEQLSARSKIFGISSSPERELIPNRFCKWLPFVCRREDREELALYEEREIGDASTD
jgi:hypothetical protein